MQERHRGLSYLTMLIVALSAGCSSLDSGVETTRVLRAKGVGFVEKADRDMGESAVTWDTIVEATAEGLAPQDVVNPVQRRLMATEAATYRAMAQVAENVRGIHVTKKSRVQDMAFAGENVEAQTAGAIEGVKILRRDYDDETGIAEVTVRVGLDTEGNIIPDRMLPVTPLSLAVRRVRGESAARINAVASLREQVGEIYVGQVVKVKDLVFMHQKAWLLVEGMLEGVQFSEPEWVSSTQCVIEATLVVSAEDLEKLRDMEPLPEMGR